MTDFLHGVETFETLVGPKKIAQPKSAVIGLVGTAPIHRATNPLAVNELGLVRTDRDNAAWGPSSLAGYSIPRALEAIQRFGAGLIVVINVFDPATMRETVAGASRAITAGKITLPHADIISVTVATTDVTPVPCVEGDDYTIDLLTGILTVVPGGELDGEANATVGYVRADPSEVTSTHIIGETTAENVRTGAQALRNAMGRWGFHPKVLIAPGHTEEAEVVTALNTLAQPLVLRAIVLADVDHEATMLEAIEGRGPDGDVDLTSTSDRVWYTYPRQKRVTAAGVRFEPYSQYVAGAIALTDARRGYHVPVDNKPIVGTSGLEVELSAALNDPNCDVNQLNAVGITTAFAAFGAGFSVWGNRSAAFPSSQAVTTFMNVRRTLDMVDEAIEQASKRFIGEVIGDPLIQEALADIGAFIRSLVSRGALVAGSRVEFFPEDNPVEELAAGHITWTRTVMVGPATERITYKSVVDVTLLANLGG